MANKKGSRQLTWTDRISIEALKKAGHSVIEIAEQLGVHRSTIYNELKRGEYMLWSSIFVTLMANKIGGLQFGIYRNCQISSRVFHTAVAALPLTKANRSDFE